MVQRANQLKRLVGLLLEAVFLVFIISFSSLASQPVNADDDSGLALIVLAQPIGRSDQTIAADSNLDLDIISFFAEIPTWIIDLPALAISNSKAFFVNLFERSAFYVFTTTNAP